MFLLMGLPLIDEQWIDTDLIELPPIMSQSALVRRHHHKAIQRPTCHYAIAPQYRGTPRYPAHNKKAHLALAPLVRFFDKHCLDKQYLYKQCLDKSYLF